eukprot:5159678-Prymnesium_polylepis.1
MGSTPAARARGREGGARLRGQRGRRERGGGAEAARAARARTCSYLWRRGRRTFHTSKVLKALCTVARWLQENPPCDPGWLGDKRNAAGRCHTHTKKVS